jgi:GNAT superfamily N-acetyltransferase
MHRKHLEAESPCEAGNGTTEAHRGDNTWSHVKRRAPSGWTAADLRLGCQTNWMHARHTMTEELLPNSNVSIRTACPDDTARIAELSVQLGYPVTAGGMRSRLEAVLADEDHLVLVAESQDKQIVGWLHADVRRTPLSEPGVNVAGLVVDQKFRRNGVGRALMREAEAWTLARGFKWVSLRSNVVRNHAHNFYERLGYERVKTQHAYRKPLHP